jgi:FKBP-type peptidyl-prolyl cis-trans isomerase
MMLKQQHKGFSFKASGIVVCGKKKNRDGDRVEETRRGEKKHRKQRQSRRERPGTLQEGLGRGRMRRDLLALTACLSLSCALPVAAAKAKADEECASCSDSNSSLQPGDKAFATSASGLRILDVKVGKGPTPKAGDVVVVDWSGYTSGYQAKRIDNTNNTDNQFVFKLGAQEAIPAFEEAVSGMKVGGVRRVEIPGELEQKLAYPVDKQTRYAQGPKPFSIGGLRALDFVLDNKTLKSFNKTLLFDIR